MRRRRLHAFDSTNPDRNGVFEDGIVPKRSQEEQADYLGAQFDLLTLADVHAVFVYVFSSPCMRAGEGPKDLDMMCFSLVKSLPDCDARLKAMPPWVPKESFHSVPTTSGVWHSQSFTAFTFMQRNFLYHRSMLSCMTIISTQ
jgi:hypothetical protein